MIFGRLELGTVGGAGRGGKISRMDEECITDDWDGDSI
jgi:hypothetical protein